MPPPAHPAHPAHPNRRNASLCVGAALLLPVVLPALGQSYFAGVPQPEPPTGDLLDQDADTLRQLFDQASHALRSKGTGYGRIALPIYFGNDSALVSAPIRSKLAGPAAVLQEPGRAYLRLRIEGHANATGSPAHNLRLTQQRADAVRAILLGHQLDPARLVAQGLGFERNLQGTHPSDPVNRRVELWVLGA